MTLASTHLLPCLAAIIIHFLLFVGAASYTNPVFSRSQMPDPGTLWDPNSKQYISVSTGGSNFPIHTSPDLVTWTFAGWVFDEKTAPKWAGPQGTGYWAPEIHFIRGKTKARDFYVAVYAVFSPSANGERVGLATSKSPFGPWSDHGTPFVRAQPGELEVIDPTLFHDNSGDTWYLVWKSRSASGTAIWAQAVHHSMRGFRKGTRPTLLMRNTLPWEGWTVEGPTVHYRKGYYYLFYSGNSCCIGVNSLYRVGVARSRKPLGPYRKHGAAILNPNPLFVGPGHGTVLKLAADSTKTMFVHHSYVRGALAKSYGNGRYLMLDEVLWSKDGWPYFKNGSPMRTASVPK